MNPSCDAGCGRPAEYVIDVDDLPDRVFVCERHLRELVELSD